MLLELLPRNKSKRGFTLIEVIIYAIVVTLILIVVINFTWTIIQGQRKNTSHQEVEQNGHLLLEIISRNIRSAQAINSPTIGNSGEALSLSMSEAEKNPTIFDLSDGVLRIKQGLSGPFNLTTNQVEIKNLSFINLSRTDQPQVIKIFFTLAYKNPSGQFEYRAEADFTTTITLRK